MLNEWYRHMGLRRSRAKRSLRTPGIKEVLERLEQVLKDPHKSN